MALFNYFLFNLFNHKYPSLFKIPFMKYGFIQLFYFFYLLELLLELNIKKLNLKVSFFNHFIFDLLIFFSFWFHLIYFLKFYDRIN